MKKLLFAFGITALAIACSPKTVEPITDVDPVEEKDNSMAAIDAGKSVYQSKCTKCHEAKTISNFTKEQWDGILPAMISKAKLDSETASQVSKYVYWSLEQ